MEIRLLDKQALNRITQLSHHDIVDYHKKLIYNSKQREFFCDPAVLTYVCYNAKDIAGYISFQLKNTYIYDLWIESQDNQKQIFDALIQTVEKLCIYEINVFSNDYIDLFLQSGFVWNNQKNMLVKKIGARQQFKNYEEVYAFINSQKDRVYSLDNFQKFMHDMADIQQALKCVHIGGTNGKGSTTNYIKEVLVKAGYRVGTFTSPALITRLDVIRINDINIDDRFVVEIANRYVETWLKYEISLFEIEVFIAVMYYLYQQVDIALFEVGLGGSLDATNIIHPLVAVNTNIGLDHVEYLGNSYESIAKAKAGIIKDGVDFITGEDKQECLDIFRDVCEQHHSQLLRVERIHDIQDGDNVKYSYRGYNIVLDSPALYQIKNSALAIETLLYLKDKGEIHFCDDDLIYGIFEAKWAGRFEILRDNPLIIVDGAHNREGVDELYRAARKFHDLKIIFSALKDKDTDYMIERLLELTYDITVCEFEHPRAQSAELLAKNYPVKIEPDYHKAIDDAFDHQGTLLITGSLYFISKVRTYIQDKCGYHS